MSQIATDNLFLLEFVVDKVSFNPKFDSPDLTGNKCVSFQFLDNPPLEVCEADFNPKASYGSADFEQIKNGKSCLFSLTPDQAEMLMIHFDVFTTVAVKPCGQDEFVDIGETIISIAPLFMDLVASLGEDEITSPIAKTIKDDYGLINDANEIVGSITVYIRISCFGKLIVTQFQMNTEDNSVLFQDKEGKSLYKYKKAATNKSILGNGSGEPNHQQMIPCNECGGLQDPACATQAVSTQAEGEAEGEDEAEGTPQVGVPFKCPCQDCKYWAEAPCVKGEAAYNEKMKQEELEREAEANKKEVFTLVMGKKKEGQEKKINLEVELCSPKGVVVKPVAKRETRDCQYDPKDIDEKNGKKGKGNGKKGGGKKK